MQTPTPQKNTPQSARKSSRPNPPREESQKFLQSIQSDNDAYNTTPQEGEQTPSKRNRKPRKKSIARKNGVQSDVGEMPDPNIRHYHHSEKHKHTPAKPIKSDAYAGPTFHQSPAPSALPMPSMNFVSRSVPINDTKQEVLKEVEDKRETTPLDWMFETARQARQTPNGSSPARLKSPPTESPRPSPAPRKDETDFPFELDSADESKSVYSTPLTHRFAASRSPQPTADGGLLLTDEERKAKTAALKKALMNPNPPQQLGPAFNDNNPFNARNAPLDPRGSPRYVSNPTTPSYQQVYGGNQNTQYFPYAPTTPSRNYPVHPNSNRPPSSNLRNIYEPSLGPTMVTPNTTSDQLYSITRTSQPARALNFEAIYGPGTRPQSEGSATTHSTQPSLAQGLDDLKKALNMNLLGQT